MIQTWEMEEEKKGEGLRNGIEQYNPETSPDAHPNVNANR